MKFLNYKEIIPTKYVIPESLLQEFRNFIAQNMPPKKTGRPRVDSEPLIAGMYYLLRTGCQWEALPLCFGPSKTIYQRFRELIWAGAFQKIWKTVLILYDREIGLALHNQSIDSNHKKSPLGGDKTGISPVDRRKLGTKLNLVVEEAGIPIGATIASGNRHDTQLFIGLIDNLQQQIPQSKNHYLRTDKGFVSKKNKAEAVKRNFTPVMPLKKPKNKPRIESEKDLKRWVVERTFSWINRFRRIFTRYEKLSINFLALVQFAFQVIIIKKI
jgi:putative transposase